MPGMITMCMRVHSDIQVMRLLDGSNLCFRVHEAQCTQDRTMTMTDQQRSTST